MAAKKKKRRFIKVEVTAQQLEDYKELSRVPFNGNYSMWVRITLDAEVRRVHAREERGR